MFAGQVIATRDGIEPVTYVLSSRHNNQLQTLYGLDETFFLAKIYPDLDTDKSKFWWKRCGLGCKLMLCSW
jgi:hypothetical protein